MRVDRSLPVLATATQAYALLWQHRSLHAKAIWPSVVFLVTAEFLYHRAVGDAGGLAGRWHALLEAPRYLLVAMVAAWIAGLKFLLSFSISWRRHLLLGERFDPFFLDVPFWRYLGFLLLTYVWIIPLILLAFVPAGLIVATHVPTRAELAAVAIGLPTLAFVVWAIVRQVPFFTVLTLDPPQPGWRESTDAMRGTVRRYVATFVLATLPVIALSILLDFELKRAGADRHSVHVALEESALRQTMLFVHFSLGASIGAITTAVVLPRGRSPVFSR